MSTLQPFPQPPYQSPLTDNKGILTHPWQKWIQQLYIAVGSATGVITNVSSVTAQTLFNSFASPAQLSVFTVPTGKNLVISAFTAQNGGSLPATISVWLVPANQSASSSNLIINSQSIAANSSLSLSGLVNQVLTSGGQIVIQASNMSTFVAASGRVSS